MESIHVVYVGGWCVGGEVKGCSFLYRLSHTQDYEEVGSILQVRYSLFIDILTYPYSNKYIYISTSTSVYSLLPIYIS